MLTTRQPNYVQSFYYPDIYKNIISENMMLIYFSQNHVYIENVQHCKFKIVRNSRNISIKRSLWIYANIWSMVWLKRLLGVVYRKIIPITCWWFKVP